MSDNDVMGILLSIKEDIGEIKGTLNGHVRAFDDHVQMDMKAYKAIGELQRDSARQKGFITALGFAASGLGAALGWLVERVTLGHH